MHCRRTRASSNWSFFNRQTYWIVDPKNVGWSQSVLSTNMDPSRGPSTREVKRNTTVFQRLLFVLEKAGNTLDSLHVANFGFDYQKAI